MLPTQDKLFSPGERVRLTQAWRKRAIGRLTVVRDDRSEITLKDSKGSLHRFLHLASARGWKLLHEDMDGSRAFSRRGPTYQILPV